MKASAYAQNIVIDLEFTPVPKGSRVAGLRYEIIEIGAVRVDAQGRVLDSFRQLVKPQIAQTVAGNVQRLTGIITQNLEDAPDFATALARFEEWIGQGKRTRMIAWSTCDEAQLTGECLAKGIEVPGNMGRWLDLQKVYPRVMEVGREGRLMSLHTAIEWTGIDLKASDEHRALADAEHTAELLALLITDEYQDYKRVLASFLPQRRKKTAPKTNFGPMAGSLAALYQQMLAQEAPAVA